ncbi:hypothetical protein ACFX1Q_028626 [Malus domestica]
MEGSSSAAADATIETLSTRGWFFGNLEQVEEKILIYPALSDGTRTVVNSVEAELTNMNLKSISARSMPNSHKLLRSSHLLGPKVLQLWSTLIPRQSLTTSFLELSLGSSAFQLKNEEAWMATSSNPKAKGKVKEKEK